MHINQHIFNFVLQTDDDQVESSINPHRRG